MAQRHFLRLHLEVAQPALLVRQRSLEQDIEVLFRQRPQLENLRARDQWGIYEEEWVVRRRPDQPHDAALDIRQKDVLLRLVEPVNLVNEEDRGLPLVLQP